MSPILRGRRRFRTTLASLTAIALSVGLLAACGSNDEQPASDSPTASGYDEHGPITLVSAKEVTGSRAKEVAAWNADHPDEKVQMIDLPDAADQQRQQLINNAQVKSDQFTVIRIDAVWTAEFAANQWVDEISRDQFPMEGYLPATIDTVTYFDKLYAVPDATGAGLLFYRKDLLDDVGLEPPTTWAEMKAACDKIKAKPANKNLGCYAGQFNKYEGLTVNFAEAVASAGGSITTDGKPTVNTPEAREGLDFLVDGFKNGTIPKGAITWQEEEGRQAFQGGKLIFLRNWAYVYALADQTDGSSKVAGKFDVAPLPGKDGPGVSMLGGNNFAISSFAKNKGTAVDFITYLNTPEAQKERLLKTAAPPPLGSLYTEPDLVKKYPYLPALKTSIEKAQSRPKVVNYGDVTLAIQDAAYAALQRQISPDVALKTLQAKLETLIT
ncbi:MAG: ABC transporter substrate-binding protein [Microlunatus sp.]|nr:ABC transporter substrate-binding protein [Microlunatus sp.]MDN5769377.1 ABC transporter substrate-binding protein [Microlunatus sp.]